MSIEIWVSFITFSIVLTFTPGPIVVMTMGQALTHGKKSVLPLVTGVLCGDIIAMILSLTGIGILLSTSAVLFNAFKWIGAAYLIFIGLKTIFKKTSTHQQQTNPISKKHIFREAVLIASLNPKSILFYTTFFPLFIDASKPAINQIMVLGIAFQLISIISITFYSLISSYLSGRIMSEKFQRGFNKVSGSMLIGAGAITASIQK